MEFTPHGFPENMLTPMSFFSLAFPVSGIAPPRRFFFGGLLSHNLLHPWPILRDLI